MCFPGEEQGRGAGNSTEIHSTALLRAVDKGTQQQNGHKENNAGEVRIHANAIPCKLADDDSDDCTKCSRHHEAWHSLQIVMSNGPSCDKNDLALL